MLSVFCVVYNMCIAVAHLLDLDLITRRRIIIRLRNDLQFPTWTSSEISLRKVIMGFGKTFVLKLRRGLFGTIGYRRDSGNTS